MKFAISYSFGKDSALTLHKMIEAGHEPVCLITTVNNEAGRSWFHGVDEALMEAVSRSLGIPLVAARCRGEDYVHAFESALGKAREMGAECCAFGDIDIAGHLEWNRDRCLSAGLECELPLWGMERTQAVSELLDAGFRAIIKCVDNRFLGDEYLGSVLDAALIDKIVATGADACGENGEYHTFVSDGPTFKLPVPITLGELVNFGNHSAIDIRYSK